MNEPFQEKKIKKNSILHELLIKIKYHMNLSHSNNLNEIENTRRKNNYVFTRNKKFIHNKKIYPQLFFFVANIMLQWRKIQWHCNREWHKI